MKSITVSSRSLGRIVNERPLSVLGNEERTIYEALCRNEVPVVSGASLLSLLVSNISLLCLLRVRRSCRSCTATINGTGLSWCTLLSRWVFACTLFSSIMVVGVNQSHAHRIWLSWYRKGIECVSATYRDLLERWEGYQVSALSPRLLWYQFTEPRGVEDMVGPG